MAVVLIDERLSEALERRLILLGHTPIRIKASGVLGADVASHPDMLVFHDKETLITTCAYAEEAPHVFTDIRLSANVNIRFCDEEQFSDYPRDCILNAIRFKDMLFCKSDSVSRAVLSYARERDLKIVSVNQGYPRCTVLKLSDGAAITADRGMARALSENGIRVYLINNGNITLPCRSYGFIGGAGGVFENTVYFTGNIDTHPDACLIKDAIKTEKMALVCLSDGNLFDGGGLIFL